LIGRAVIYIENPDKTGNPQCWESRGSGADLQCMEDVMEFAMTDKRVSGLGHVLEYATDGKKTEQQYFVSALNCEVSTARDEMMQTKLNWNKTGGNTAYHAYQAFKPGEVSPEQCHEIGVRLAQKLWGERFEVVIATHLDKGHLHNHFLLNSVSFVDGYKFYDSERFYRRMQRESDALCREYALSVIDNPKPRRTRHYGEIQAEREGKPTWRGLLKAEIDEAVSQSMTESQLVMALQKRGYRVKLRGKDISICPPGREDYVQNYVRLGKNFGEAYYREGLMRQMRTQGRPKLPEPKRAVKAVKCKGSLKTVKKLTGFRALYFHYLYLLGKLPKRRPRPPSKVHALYREDFIKIDKISKEIMLLCRYRIDTEEQLSSFREGLAEELKALTDQRRELRNRIRRPKDEATVTEIKKDISSLSARMSDIRKEVVLCGDIAVRSRQIKDKMSEQKQTKNLNRKERNRYEPFR
jgi:hypothetical protein